MPCMLVGLKRRKTALPFRDNLEMKVTNHYYKQRFQSYNYVYSNYNTT